MSTKNPRAVAACVLKQVLSGGRSLSDALESEAAGARSSKDQALTQELCYGVLRWLPRLAVVADSFLQKPFKPKDKDLHCLVLLGLYQLMYLRVPQHAAVHQTAEAAREINKQWAVGLINGVLRAYLRDPQRAQSMAAQEPAALAHPDWLCERLERAWPDDWRALLQANNARPPLWLRVNARRQPREVYLEEMRAMGRVARPSPYASQAVLLEEAVPVARIPGFTEGRVSVQDAAAQLSAPLLDVRTGDRVLDACAAPGGKTGHLLEAYPMAKEIVALDRDPQRAQRIRENLDRLGLHATVCVADVAQSSDWWDGRWFQQILLDVPCSATGVIRRHPDIKWLRREDDIPLLAEQQQRLLGAVWPLLEPGGRLLYVTCSVLPEENDGQIGRFLAAHRDAREEPVEAAWGHGGRHGRQILPGEDGMDGFYYACLRKIEC